MFGTDSLEQKKKGVFLIVADETLSASSMKTLIECKERFSCPLLWTAKGVLGESVSRPSVKAMGVGEKNLAAAILKEAEESDEWKLYSGGIN